MLKITIEGIDGADGTYDLDETYFTNRDLHVIKRMSGVRVGELDAALDARDNDVMLALVVIAMARAGRSVPEDALWDAPLGKIRFEAVAEARDASPPSPLPNAPGSSSVGDVRPQTSGDSSSGTGDPQVIHLPPTGTQG